MTNYGALYCGQSLRRPDVWYSAEYTGIGRHWSTCHLHTMSFPSRRGHAFARQK